MGSTDHNRHRSKAGRAALEQQGQPVTPADIKDRTPNPDTIGLLERLLADAKSGELRTVVIVEGDWEDGWCTTFSIDRRNTSRRMIGEVTMMYHEIVTRQLIVEDSPLRRALYGE